MADYCNEMWVSAGCLQDPSCTVYSSLLILTVVVVDVDCSRLCNPAGIVLLLRIYMTATLVQCPRPSARYELIRQKEAVAETLEIAFLSLLQLHIVSGNYQTGTHNQATPIPEYRPRP